MAEERSNQGSFIRKWFLGQTRGTSEDNIKKDVEDLLALYVKRKGGSLRTPVDLEYLANLRGCTIQRCPLPSGSSGVLLPRRNGFLIKVNSLTSVEVRQRFSIAHEIGHTFFYHINPDGRPKKVINLRDAEEEEKLCDLVAGMLLVPKVLLDNVPLRKVSKISLGEVLAGAKLFKVSREVAARRLKTEMPHTRVGFCEWWHEDRYLKTRKIRFGHQESYDPYVLGWLVPPDLETNINVPRGTRLKKGSSISEFILGTRKSVLGTEVKVGRKLTARLEKAFVTRVGGRPERILASITELKTFS